MKGLRHKATGRLYYHASTQTLSAKSHVEAFSRDTQTVLQKNRYIQAPAVKKTQGTRKWLFMDDANDVTVYLTGIYETAKEYHARRLSAVLTIQRFMRGCNARRLYLKLRVEHNRKKEAEREQLEEQEKIDKEQKQQELNRRTNPKTKSDFRLLFEELEDWFTKELQKIKESSMSEQETTQRLLELTLQRTRLQQTIEKLQIKAKKESEEAKKVEVLDQLSAPKKLAMRNGDVIEVHTPGTTHFAQNKKLYEAIANQSNDETTRRELLTHLILLNPETSTLISRIQTLAQRELDFLDRNLPVSGLRTRLSSCLYEFCVLD